VAKLPQHLAKFWDYAINTTLDYTSYYSHSDTSKTDTQKRLEGAYQALTTGKKGHHQDSFAWCLKKSSDRINAIVSNTYRHSYHKAALLTVTCTEMLKELKKSAEANKFYRSIQQRYPRHSAFQAELKTIQH